MGLFGKSIARRFDAGEELEDGEVLDVALTENGVYCTAVIDEKDHFKWLKKNSTVNVAKTKDGVVVWGARIGE